MGGKQPFIVIGDKTSHGGTVVGGATTATTHGKVIARVGDKVTCPKCGGSTTIATGDNTMIIMGQPVARHGDKTACGATLIASQSVTTSGSGGGAGGGTRAAAAARAATTAAVAAAIASSPVAAVAEPSSHALGFRLTDEATGVPLARQPIRLLVDGVSSDAVTDGEGCVQAVYTGDTPQNVECHILGIDDLLKED